MKVWWRYRCDEGHAWEFFREEDSEERGDDVMCEHGHEAVTLQKFKPADGVRIALVPTERVMDAVTGKTSFSNRFLLELSAWPESECRLSRSAFDWSEAVRRAEQFRGLSSEAAFGRWDRAGLGNQLHGQRTNL